MNSIKNQQLEGKNGRPFLMDVYWNEGNKTPKPILVFMHGFKGFKDWGHWEQIAWTFAKAGYCFVKFNFSHNGTTVDDALNFADLEAFGQNNYSKELADLEVVLDWIAGANDWEEKINWESANITLIGHSRGGPIALIGAKEQKNVQRVITWAAVHELDYAWQKEVCQISTWKKEGVYHVMNGRTKQNMPLYYQLYENYQQNATRLSVHETLKALDKPCLIVHGDGDPAVPAKAADYLMQHASLGQLKIIKDANHVFGGKHPYRDEKLPVHSQILVEHCLDFLKEPNKG